MKVSPDISWICATVAQDIGFTGKFMKELRISDYQRLKKYFLWNQ